MSDREGTAHPQGWSVAELGNVVADTLLGCAARGTGGGAVLPLIKMGNLTWGGFNLTQVEAVSEEKVDPRQLLQHDDLLFNTRNTPELVGKTAVWHEELPRATFDNNILRIRLDRSVHADFLCCQLSHGLGRARLRARAAGSTSVAAIYWKDLCRVPILVPPLGEQRKIAAILSSVDDAIEATQAVIDQLQVVKKAMMAELLTRGVPGRHTRFKLTEIGEVPEEWEVVRIGDVCSTVTKGATPAAQTRDSGEVPFLKVYNLDPKGFVDFGYQPTFIPRSVHNGELKRSRVAPGDVLMNIVGPPLGKVAVVPDYLPDANINQAIAVMRPASVESMFLAACLSESNLFSWALSRAKRTSTQLNLTLELCRDYPMPLPPEGERIAILRMLEATAERLRVEERNHAQLATLKSALMAVLLTGEVRVKPDEEAA